MGSVGPFPLTGQGAKCALLPTKSPPGGGGTLNIYWWGCAAAHPKRGVLGTGTTQKWGVLGTGTTQKGGLRHGHESKKTILVTVVAQREVLVAYLLITLTFSCQYDQLVGVYSDKKRGVLGTGQVKKGGS